MLDDKECKEISLIAPKMLQSPNDAILQEDTALFSSQSSRKVSLACVQDNRTTIQPLGDDDGPDLAPLS